MDCTEARLHSLPELGWARLGSFGRAPESLGRHIRWVVGICVGQMPRKIPNVEGVPIVPSCKLVMC